MGKTKRATYGLPSPSPAAMIQGFPKRDARFSKLKYIPDLLGDDKGG